MGGTSASPSTERNSQSLKTTAIVYSKFLLGKRHKLEGHVAERSQLTLQLITKLSWARHIRWVERNQMSRKEQIQLSSQVPEERVLHNFSGKLWILNFIKCLLKTTLNYCRHYSLPRKNILYFSGLLFYSELKKQAQVTFLLRNSTFRAYRFWRIPAQWNTAHSTLSVRKLIVFSKKVKKKFKEHAWKTGP